MITLATVLRSFCRVACSLACWFASLSSLVALGTRLNAPDAFSSLTELSGPVLPEGVRSKSGFVEPLKRFFEGAEGSYGDESHFCNTEKMRIESTINDTYRRDNIIIKSAVASLVMLRISPLLLPMW
eukprot:9473993-Pyramimonas_sp.AAC.1